MVVYDENNYIDDCKKRDAEILKISTIISMEEICDLYEKNKYRIHTYLYKKQNDDDSYYLPQSLIKYDENLKKYPENEHYGIFRLVRYG